MDARRGNEMPHDIQFMVANVLKTFPAARGNLGGDVTVWLLCLSDDLDNFVHLTVQGFISRDAVDTYSRFKPFVYQFVLPMCTREFALFESRGDA